MGKYRNKAMCLMVRIIYLYSVMLGISTVRIDFAKRRVIKSRWISIYATCVNVAIGISLPFALQATLILVRRVSDNWLIQMTGGAYVGVHLSAILLTMMLRWKRERRTIENASIFFALESCYFGQLSPHEDIERRFATLLFAKTVTMVGQMAASMYSMLHMTEEMDAFIYALAVYFANAKYMLHGILFHYFASLWHACKRFEILNAQLNKLLMEMPTVGDYGNQMINVNVCSLQQICRRTTSELQQIAEAHWRLTQLLQSLCDNYILQTLAVLLTYALHTIAFGYFAVLMMDGSFKLKLSVLSRLLGIISYFTLLTDLYLFYRMCHIITDAYQDTAAALRGFQALPFVNSELEHCCECFSLQLAQRKLHINMAGMFDLNLQALLSLWAFIICHTIILVQFDLENRLRQRQPHAS